MTHLNRLLTITVFMVCTISQGFSQNIESQKQSFNSLSETNEEKVQDRTVQTLLSGGFCRYVRHDEPSYWGVVVESGLLMDSMVYVGLEPILIFEGSAGGIGGFLNVGRQFSVNEFLQLRTSGGFGYLNMPFIVQRDRYFCQAKTDIIAGKNTIKGAVSYSLMAGTALGHRFVASIIWYTGRKAS